MRGIEVTHSWAHGFHPHLHLAMLTDDWSEHEREVLVLAFVDALVVEATAKITNARGRVVAWDVESYRHWRAYFGAFDENAIRWSARKLRWSDVRDAAPGASTDLEVYLTDMGLELTLDSTKTTRQEGSRTPWQIAAAAVKGSEPCANLWREYELAMKGTRCIELDDRAVAFTRDARRAYDRELEASSPQGELDFSNAPTVGDDFVEVVLHPEMLSTVRAYERIDPRATKLWLDAARAPGELTERAVSERIDACIRAMASAIASRVRVAA